MPPPAVAARTCGFTLAGCGGGVAESRVEGLEGFAAEGVSREGEAARRAAREWVLTSGGVLLGERVEGEGWRRTPLLYFCGFGHFEGVWVGCCRCSGCLGGGFLEIWDPFHNSGEDTV